MNSKVSDVRSQMSDGQARRIGGFTLIELLVVVAIIGVLAGLVTVNLQDARERARDVQRKSDVRAIQSALELYKNDQKPATYPADLADLVTGNYIKAVPEDPVARQNPGGWPDYSYTQDPLDTLAYDLVVCLENGADVDRDATNNTTICTSGVSFTKTEP